MTYARYVYLLPEKVDHTLKLTFLQQLCEKIASNLSFHFTQTREQLDAKVQSSNIKWNSTRMPQHAIIFFFPLSLSFI